jgi:hypothetical protein
VELPVAQLVQAVAAAPADEVAALLKAACGKYVEAPAGTECPCPPEELVEFANEAAEDVERRRLLRERLVDLWSGD